MFITRLISGIIVLLIAIGIVAFGTVPLWFASILLSGIAMYELYKAFGMKGSALSYVSYVLSVFYYFLVLFNVDAIIIAGKEENNTFGYICIYLSEIQYK